MVSVLRVPRAVTYLTIYVLPAMMPVVEQLETIIAQAVRPGADGTALLKQAQSLVDN